MLLCVFCFFFKQKTAYEMRISDWSSDVCSSDLHCRGCCSNPSHAWSGSTLCHWGCYCRILHRYFDHCFFAAWLAPRPRRPCSVCRCVDRAWSICSLGRVTSVIFCGHQIHWSNDSRLAFGMCQPVVSAHRSLHKRRLPVVGPRPNNSFNPNPLRYTNSMADHACHAVGSTTQVGLTQALGLMTDIHPLFFVALIVLLGWIGLTAIKTLARRSQERRVGNECGSPWRNRWTRES